MNCYGTNPRYTQQVQPVNNMNTMNTGRPGFNYTTTVTGTDTVNTQNPYATNSFGEWGQQVPVNPNMATSPVSYPVAPAPLPAPAPDASLPDTLTEPIYTPGYLRTHIGDLMRVEFLIGNSTTDRVGRLRQVGASFIVLSALDGGSEIVCDIYSIKFVTIIQSNLEARLYTSFGE